MSTETVRYYKALYAEMRKERARKAQAPKAAEQEESIHNLAALHKLIKWRTAVHEAGHAVIGRALGYRIDLIDLDPYEDHASGETIFKAFPKVTTYAGPRTAERADYKAIVACAGAAAVQVICGKGSSDRCSTADLAHFKKTGQDFDKTMAVARHIADELREDIEIVAKAAQRRRRLTGADVERELAERRRKKPTLRDRPGIRPLRSPGAVPSP